MAKVYFVCGFIGSGKTTYSKILADRQGAFRFSIDEWMIPLYGEHMEREVFD
ncbi:AAA family ATPase, partial [Veronia pacifica]